MYDFLRGPMVWIAFAGFFGGLLFQGFFFFRSTQKKEKKLTPLKKEKLSFFSSKHWLSLYQQSVFAQNPVMAAVSTLFHVLLLTTPLLVFAHNFLWEQSIGFGLFSLSDLLTDLMTFVFLLCGFFFLFRRVMIRQVRAISSGSDILALFLTLAPFLTGFFAYHHWLDYKTMLMAHMAFGELMLLAIPFTKLGHMIFVFLYRFFIGTEFSFGPGTRAW